MAKSNITAFALLLLLAGCVSSGTEVTATDAAQFKDGVTTESQVIAKLGEPDATATAADGTKTDSYVHISARPTAATWIPVVGLFAGGAKGTTDTATFTFTPAGILKSISSSTGHSDVRTGLLNQK